MGRDQLIPEITFLDPRGVGKWEMVNRADVLPAVWAMDVDDAGPYGYGYYGAAQQSPPSEEVTPRETLADQSIRLRQVMSNLEAQYSRDTILLIFPDGTGPALLSAMMAGIPYNQVHELEFAPGEVRLDVTYESARALYQTKQNDPAYAVTIKQGRAKLAKLRSETTLENERLAIEQALQEKQIQEGEIERQRQLQELIAKNKEKTTSPGVLAAAAGVSVVAGAVWVGITSQDNDNVATDDLSKLSPTDTSDTTSTSLDTNGVPIALSSSLPLLTPPAGSSLPSPAPKMRGTGNDTQPYEYVPLNGQPLMNDVSFEEQIRNRQKKPSLYDSPPPPSEDDRAKSAEVAMQEYLDEDDGGGDWLRAMVEIIEEDEDSELLPTDEPTGKINGSDGGLKRNIENL
jgi:hypothetical protein